MTGLIFLYTASIILCGWGIAHIFPTRAVVRGFGDISADNKRTITMEWIIEGVTLIFIGIVIAFTTLTDPFSKLAGIVFGCIFFMLNILSIISLFTGFKNSFLPFKLCPFIFTGASLLLLLGAILI